ncbi:MAG: HAD-IA family hydrolase [Sulfuricella sp.]|nr:HAD-IA family hydrolase [Sulfuricella sp.]
MVEAVFFDLDGTLADTAPDLGYALNLVRRQRGLEPLALEIVRPYASHGARGLLEIGLGLTPAAPDFGDTRQEFLAFYERYLCHHTTLFPGIGELLTGLEERGIPWGVVTNKPARYTDPLMEQLGLTQRAVCIVSGDTCANSKPHPEPMLYACSSAGVEPHRSLYLGDAERDIEAARAAGMPALVALYGYLDATDRPEDWQAAGSVATPLEVLNHL